MNLSGYYEWMFLTKIVGFLIRLRPFYVLTYRYLNCYFIIRYPHFPHSQVSHHIYFDNPYHSTPSNTVPHHTSSFYSGCFNCYYKN